ncbi:MAG: pilus assembly protein PilP [Desulfobacterales bacterium]
MKKMCIRLRIAVVLLCHLIFLAPSTLYAQKINAWDKVGQRVIKKKIYPMPQAESDISASPPRVSARRSKSDMSRPSSVKPAKKHRQAAPAHVSSENQTPPYDPSGEIDPFVSLIKDKPIVKPGPVVPTIPTRPAETLLEKIDLSQLKLTAIILRNGGNRGLAQGSSGRGHVIAENTYIGTHGGRVAEIKKDRVIIEEKAIDDFGKTVVEKKEMVAPSYLTKSGSQTPLN